MTPLRLSVLSLAFASFVLAGLFAATAADSLSVALVAACLVFGVVAVSSVATSGLSRGSGRRRHPLASALFALAIVLAVFVGSARAEPWGTDLCVRPTGVGAASQGAPFTILGSAGSSVRKLRVYRNNGKDGYLRGIVVFFSDGTEMRGGVRKDQFSDFDLADGEVVTAATLWQMSNSTSGARVARLDFSTSSRSWGFGVENTAKLSSKGVNVGSGILVGFQGSAGDDLDFLAPIFLKTMSSSTVSDIVFEKFGDTDGLKLVTLREGSAVFNGTDYSWTFSGSESRDSSTSFSSGTSASFGASTTFALEAPAIIKEAGITASWTFGTTSSFDKHSGKSRSLSWSTTVALSKDVPAVSCSALVWEGRLDVAWTGTQTIVTDGRSISFPTSGNLRHVDYGKVETVCRPMAPVAPAKRAKRWVA